MPTYYKEAGKLIMFLYYTKVLTLKKILTLVCHELRDRVIENIYTPTGHCPLLPGSNELIFGNNTPK